MRGLLRVTLLAVCTTSATPAQEPAQEPAARTDARTTSLSQHSPPFEFEAARVAQDNSLSCCTHKCCVACCDYTCCPGCAAPANCCEGKCVPIPVPTCSDTDYLENVDYQSGCAACWCCWCACVRVAVAVFFCSWGLAMPFTLPSTFPSPFSAPSLFFSRSFPGNISVLRVRHMS